MINKNNILEFQWFKKIVSRTLGKHAPVKKQYVRAFITKKVKEIMKMSRLRNKFLNSKSVRLKRM